MAEIKCACSCGKAEAYLQAGPLLRFRCHCLVCQRVFDAPFSHATMTSSRNVRLTDPGSLMFKRHKPPPNISRGACRSCGDIIAEFMLPGIAFIPVAAFPPEHPLPELVGDIFYHRRRLDVDDDLPKVSGYLRSMMFLPAMSVRALVRRRHLASSA